MICPQVSVWASLRERSVALATHAHNDLFTWKQRKRRWLRAGMEGIGQLTSNQGSSGNLDVCGLIIWRDQVTALARVWKCRADVSMCAARKNLTLCRMSKCVCASPVQTLSALQVVWISIWSTGNQNVVPWHHDSGWARLQLQFAACAVEVKIIWAKINAYFFSAAFHWVFLLALGRDLPGQPPLTDKPPTAAG